MKALAALTALLLVAGAAANPPEATATASPTPAPVLTAGAATVSITVEATAEALDAATLSNLDNMASDLVNGMWEVLAAPTVQHVRLIDFAITTTLSSAPPTTASMSLLVHTTDTEAVQEFTTQDGFLTPTAGLLSAVLEHTATLAGVDVEVIARASVTAHGSAASRESTKFLITVAAISASVATALVLGGVGVVHAVRRRSTSFHKLPSSMSGSGSQVVPTLNLGKLSSRSGGDASSAPMSTGRMSLPSIVGSASARTTLGLDVATSVVNIDTQDAVMPYMLAKRAPAAAMLVTDILGNDTVSEDDSDLSDCENVVVALGVDGKPGRRKQVTRSRRKIVRRSGSRRAPGDDGDNTVVLDVNPPQRRAKVDRKPRRQRAASGKPRRQRDENPEAVDTMELLQNALLDAGVTPGLNSSPTAATGAILTPLCDSWRPSSAGFALRGKDDATAASLVFEPAVGSCGTPQSERTANDATLGRRYPWGPSRASSKCRAPAKTDDAFGGIDIEEDAALQEAVDKEIVNMQDQAVQDIVDELFVMDAYSVSTRGVGDVCTPVGSLGTLSPSIEELEVECFGPSPLA